MGSTQTTVAIGFVTDMLAGLKLHQIVPRPLLGAGNIDIADLASRIPVADYGPRYNPLNRQLDDAWRSCSEDPKQPPGEVVALAGPAGAGPGIRYRPKPTAGAYRPMTCIVGLAPHQDGRHGAFTQ